MKHVQLQRLLFSSLLLVPSTTRAQAQSIIRVHWPDLCEASAGKELIITTVEDIRLEGRCLSVRNDEIRILSQASHVLPVMRASLSRIEMRRPHDHQLVSLRKGISGALAQEMKMVFSPLAPLGIAALPATIAWGVAATPFCWIADLTHNSSRTHEVQLL